MSTSNAMRPQGGLTWQRQKTVMVAAALPLVPLDIVLTVLFPDLPLSAPFGGAVLVQVLLVIPFQRLYRPVTRPRLIRFLVATGLVAMAVMVSAATALQVAGWGPRENA